MHLSPWTTCRLVLLEHCLGLHRFLRVMVTLSALEHFGVDPAVAASVFLTTLTDIVGFFVFLGLAALILL